MWKFTNAGHMVQGAVTDRRGKGAVQPLAKLTVPLGVPGRGAQAADEDDISVPLAEAGKGGTHVNAAPGQLLIPKHTPSRYLLCY